MFNKILDKITHYTHIPRDKFLHVLLGFLISASSGYTIVRWSGIDWLFFSGFFIAVLAGILKEYVWDKKLKKGTFEVADILYTALGGAMGLTLISVII